MRNDQQTDVLEKIIHELMPDSIRINTMSRVFNAKNGTIGATPGMTIERTYLETARGERYYEEYMVEPGTADVRVIHFSTGKKRAQVFYKEARLRRWPPPVRSPISGMRPSQSTTRPPSRSGIRGSGWCRSRKPCRTPRN
jgi:hypothetical protein